MSFEEQMSFGEQISFGQQMNYGQQMNFGEQMTSEERKEWETLCRMYHVDSLYEAIQGCREELEFLVRCAERLEPRARRNEKGQDGVSGRNRLMSYRRLRRLTVLVYAVSTLQATPFLPCRLRRLSPAVSEKGFLFNEV